MSTSLAEELKNFTFKDLRVDLLGICKAEDLDFLEPVYVGWIYKRYTERVRDIFPEGRSVVVLGYHVWDDIHEVAVQRKRGWSYPGYSSLSVQYYRLVNWLKEHGFFVYSNYPLLSYKQAARLAGLGVYGKQSLIITPQFGPWVRLALVVTDAGLVPDEPFGEDLCGNCTTCIEACPVGALTPYMVDPDRCLVGVTLREDEDWRLKVDPELRKLYEPRVTEHAHLMCTACQKACPIGQRGL